MGFDLWPTTHQTGAYIDGLDDRLIETKSDIVDMFIACLMFIYLLTTSTKFISVSEKNISKHLLTDEFIWNWMF